MKPTWTKFRAWAVPDRGRLILVGASAATLLAYGVGLAIVLIGGHGITDFHLNLLVEVVGVFAAIVVVWLLIEQRSQRQARRIRDGIETRIKLVRNGACWPVTRLTTNLFDIPPHSSQDRGPYYVRENYRELWGLLVGLSVPLGEPVPLPPMVGHSIAMWEWIMRSFVEVSNDCSRSIQDYGSGLVEYPELLESMVRVRNAVEGERTAWRFHHADVARKIEYRDTLPIHQRPDYPDSDIPDEAIRNLRTIALTTMTLIATIARTLEDWPDIPSEEDSHYEPTFFYAANGWRTEDTL